MGTESLVDARYRCWIDGPCHVIPSAHLTGAQLRALPLPSIRDTDDLFREIPGNQDVIVEFDEVVPADGQRFFTVPRFINAG